MGSVGEVHLVEEFPRFSGQLEGPLVNARQVRAGCAEITAMDSSGYRWEGWLLRHETRLLCVHSFDGTIDRLTRDLEAAGNCGDRFPTSYQCLHLSRLFVRNLRLRSSDTTLRPGVGDTFTGALDKQVALPFGKTGHHVDDHFVGWSGRVQRRLQDTYIDASVCEVTDGSDRLHEVSAKAVEAGHDQSVIRTHIVQRSIEAGTLPLRATDRVSVEVVRITASVDQSLSLDLKRLTLASGAHACVSDKHLGHVHGFRIDAGLIHSQVLGQVVVQDEISEKQIQLSPDHKA
ncbi:hypothetical protein SAMN06295981_0182 [Corynebacterium pollutisoli]|uniref:Uncharacterized protein n=1 Tax=Corynebacterium pollutisoli TaxID=1610489 RepID=A0A1X7HXA5_9CORY|nr:hypothetical protein SAMN06295981_0182 [Corynebacterium pollutisoli]